MIKIESRARCTGCGACASACPVNAISMEADEEGFLYPNVDVSICVNCGKCDKMCPVADIHQVNTGNPAAYAAQTTNDGIRQNSSSGGVFTEIATQILQQGGVVFGAAFDEKFSVRHFRAETEADLEKIRGSKYVQSTIGTAYLDAKKCLDAGRTVLFTGTPCQISGLYRFLGREYPNLYTQDIICHGVPAPIVWQKYIERLEVNAASKVCSVCFRNKQLGWRAYRVILGFSNGMQYAKSTSDDLYMRSFLRNLCLRPSCYQCAFKTKHRVSDITLADFWGIENICPDMNDNKGTSLVLLHSSKGHKLFQRASENMKYTEVDFDDAIQYNQSMIQSVPVNADREAFMECILEDGFQKKTLHFLRAPLISQIKRALKTVMRR